MGPTGSAQHSRPCASRACRSASSSLPCVRAVPARCECRNRAQASAWRSSVGTCGTTPILRCQPPSLRPSRDAARCPDRCGDAARCRCVDRVTAARLGKRTASPIRRTRLDSCARARTVAKRPRGHCEAPIRAATSRSRDAVAADRAGSLAGSSIDPSHPWRYARLPVGIRSECPSLATAALH